MTAFMGMQGTGDFTADDRPKNWREAILRLYPNGDAPLTAIMSKMASESTDDPEFKWSQKKLASQADAITGVYTNDAMSSAYVSGAVAGDVLYLKVPLALAQQIRAGHQILLQQSADQSEAVNAKVTARLVNGANSKITATLLEPEKTSGALATADRMLIIGNINPEGGEMPEAVSYGKRWLKNYTQITRTPLSITRTAKKTRLRGENKYNEMKREALELHGIEMEKNVIFSIPTEQEGANGQMERTSQGIIHYLRAEGGLEESYVNTAVVGGGTTWIDGGEEWLDDVCRRIFAFGPRERLAFVGDKALGAIQTLIKKSTSSQYVLSSKLTSYGLSVTEWRTPFGVVNMMTHPLFSREPSLQSSMLLLVPKFMKFRYIDDTNFYAEGEKQNTGKGRVDGISEEFLTEGGYEFHHGECFGFLHGFGSAHAA